MGKRKAEEDLQGSASSKKQSFESNGLQSPGQCFNPTLFEPKNVTARREEYATSEPYHHGVISDLINPSLLKDVRREIQDNLSFTPKETDIYKIHQSGDLANLDGLDDSALRLLPNLKKLRDALYSDEFRRYLCKVTDSPAVSGQKTDMAINVYTPGCHLLCHDDVIGSRRISYILYLTDPELPWKPEWGGALRLYPTEDVKTADQHVKLAPRPDHSKSIPPAFNQLSFFAVLPGQSFHDVEEVYGSKADDEPGRVRIAISGWYHVPQEGEEGFLERDEAFDSKLSTLSQLQSLDHNNDRPIKQVTAYESSESNGEVDQGNVPEDFDLSESDLDFLLKYIAPTYLTPDALSEVSETFEDESSIILEHFLSEKFGAKVKEYVQTHNAVVESDSSSEKWEVARPPHKHRFLYLRSSTSDDISPLQDLVTNLLPSLAFRKWFYAATGMILKSHDVLARRFRRGKDYTLAQTYENDEPRVELCLSITPSSGWEEAEAVEKDDNDKGEGSKQNADTDVGGYLAYMAGDEDDGDEDGDEKSDNGVEVPADMSTGGHATRPRKQKADPAIYKAQEGDDDGVLFSMPASWNRLGIVLRDKGTMRFVKYVSQAANGDRWDVFGELEIEDEEENDDDDSDDQAIQAVEADNGQPKGHDEGDGVEEEEDSVDDASSDSDTDA